MKKEQLENEVTLLRKEMDLLLKERFEQTETYVKIKRILYVYKTASNCAEQLDEEDKRVIFNYWNPSHSFPEYMKQRYPSLWEDELLLCCLLVLGFSIMEISILFKRTRDSIYKKCKTIQSKIADSSSESLQLKDLLDNMPY